MPIMPVRTGSNASDLLHRQYINVGTSTSRGVAITPEMEAAYRVVLNEKDRILEEIREVQEELRLGELETQELLRQSQNSNDPFVKEQLARAGVQSTFVPQRSFRPVVTVSNSAGTTPSTSRALRTGAIIATQTQIFTEPVVSDESSLEPSSSHSQPDTPSSEEIQPDPVVEPETPEVTTQPEAATQSPPTMEQSSSHSRINIPGTIPVTIATLEEKTPEFPYKPSTTTRKAEIGYSIDYTKQQHREPEPMPDTPVAPVILPPEIVFSEEYHAKRLDSSIEYPGTPPPTRLPSVSVPDEQIPAAARSPAPATAPRPTPAPYKFVLQADEPFKDFEDASLSEGSLMLQRDLHMEIAAMHAAIQQRLCLAGGFILLLLILLLFY